MWFSRLKRRISHSDARSLLRRVFANCTAANPPPITTTLIGFTSSLLLLACTTERFGLPWLRYYCDAEKQPLDALVQDRELGILGIAETCEPYSKGMAKLLSLGGQLGHAVVLEVSLASCPQAAGEMEPGFCDRELTRTSKR